MATPTKKTQEERSAETRLRLLDACVDCLVDLGYSGTTTGAIQERAGLSRGALMHHYASKTDLLVASVRHLTEQRGENLSAKAQELDGTADRLSQALDALWDSFRGRLFTATVELWTASRTDAELRTALRASERSLMRPMAETLASLFGEEISSSPRFDEAIEMTLQFLRGAAFTAILRSDRERQDHIVRQWRAVFTTLIEEKVA